MGYGIVRAIPGERDCVRSHVNPPSQAQQRGGAGGSIETLHRSPKVNFLVNPTQLLLIFGDVMCPVIQKTLKKTLQNAEARLSKVGGTTLLTFTFFAKSLETSARKRDIQAIFNSVVFFSPRSENVHRFQLLSILNIFMIKIVRKHCILWGETTFTHVSTTFTHVKTLGFFGKRHDLTHQRTTHSTYRYVFAAHFHMRVGVPFAAHERKGANTS